MKEKVMVAMSGGVDSSASAYLLQKEGYQCVGATMRLMPPCVDEEKSERDTEDAKKAAERLGISHLVLDFRKEFEEKVIKNFVGTYEEGKTPNPCVECNINLKFGQLLNAALNEGAEYIATGHYARVGYDEERERYVVKKAKDLSKDQSYVLYGLGQEQLRHVIFPLGGYTKKEVRELAEKAGIGVARKKESQDICFVPNGKYWEFIEKYTKKEYPAGKFIDEEGRVLGEHKGYLRYTPGQRRGLGVAAGERIYVTAINPKENTVTLGREEALMARECIVERVNAQAIEEFKSKRAMVKTRYNMKEVPCEIEPLSDGRLRVVFDAPQRAVTPGQSAVFYEGDMVLGGGIILCATS